MSVIVTGGPQDIFVPNLLKASQPVTPVFNDPISAPSSIYTADTAASANTLIDWKETPESHVFKADLPGLKKEDVKVHVEEGGVLVIGGERKKEQEGNNERWHRVERRGGKFLRRFCLPENVAADRAKASLENGVLTVVVPKVEVKKPEIKSIEISG